MEVAQDVAAPSNDGNAIDHDMYCYGYEEGYRQRVAKMSPGYPDADNTNLVAIK